jgi:hypothetical protein
MERVMIVRLPDLMVDTWEELRDAIERNMVCISWIRSMDYPQSQTQVHVTDIIDITVAEEDPDDEITLDTDETIPLFDIGDVG